MKNQSIPLSKRIAKLISVSIIPGTLISILGDFFTPKNGEIFVMVIGVIGIILSVYIFISLLHSSSPWWIKYLGLY